MKPEIRAALEAARDELKKHQYSYDSECRYCPASAYDAEEPHSPDCSWRKAMDLIEAVLAEDDGG